MANHKSAKKMIRKIATRTLVNKSRKSRAMTFVKNLEKAIVNSDTDLAKKLFPKVQSELAKAANRNAFKLNMVSRKIKRLSARIKKVGAS